MGRGCYSYFVTSCFKKHIDFHRVCSRLLEEVEALQVLNMSFHKPWWFLTSAQVSVDYEEQVCCMEYICGWKTGKRPAAVLEAMGRHFHREAWISFSICALYHNPPIANPFLSYWSLSKTFSMNSATSARAIKILVPVLHCPSSTL